MDLSSCSQEGGMNELDAATVMQQILRGVAYMHNHKCLGLKKIRYRLPETNRNP